MFLYFHKRVKSNLNFVCCNTGNQGAKMESICHQFSFGSSHFQSSVIEKLKTMRDTLAIHHSLRDLLIVGCVTCWCLVKPIQCRRDICMRSWREVKVFHKERRLSLFRLVNFKHCQG